MPRIKGLNHVAVVVNDIESSLLFWRDAMGIDLDHIEEVGSEKVTVAFLPVGESEVELLKPMADDTGVAKFLAEKGPGLHHLCFEVDDISAMITSLKEKGVRLINEEPKILPGRKMAFIHPKSTGGVLVELYEILR